MNAIDRTSVAIIDDNADDRLVMETLLREDLGVATHDLPPNTWGEALLPVIQRYVDAGMDVLLLDMKLPLLHGVQLIRMMRRRPGLEHVRVVAVSVETDPEHVDLARRSGFDGYIGKPLDIARFAEQMRRVLAGEAVWEPK